MVLWLLEQKKSDEVEVLSVIECNAFFHLHNWLLVDESPILYSVQTLYYQKNSNNYLLRSVKSLECSMFRIYFRENIPLNRFL